ncbi:MAG: hypothetical protein H0V70_23890 [Ktedonobacteraceae bacterium]|nr:hypothetical protein [Ktedonobacteraceae bacterium]
MIPVRVEGVRRNFAAVSAFLYNVFLLDEAGQRLLMFGIERPELTCNSPTPDFQIRKREISTHRRGL